MLARAARTPVRRRAGQGLSRARTSRPRKRLRVEDGASKLDHRTRPVLARRVSLTLAYTPPSRSVVSARLPSTGIADSPPKVSKALTTSSANSSPASSIPTRNVDPTYPRPYSRGAGDPSYDLPTHHTQLFTNLGPWPTSIGVPSVAVFCMSRPLVYEGKRARTDEAEDLEQMRVRKKRWWEKEG